MTSKLYQSPIYHTLLHSVKIGSVAILWSRQQGKPLIDRIVLSRPGISAEQILQVHFHESLPLCCPEIESVMNQIQDYLKGKPIVFHPDLIRLNQYTAFQQSVLRAESAIPYGYVSTYQRIAEQLQKPSAARAVGNALAKNPFPLLIPCHRAVRSDFTPGGFQGGTAMKRHLLEMEGNKLDYYNRIVHPKIY